MSTDHETSYGGVVVRGEDVLVITPAGKRRITGLPKGGANQDETGEQAATREVREETGIVARVERPLGQVDYSYRRGGRRIDKTVHFFLCVFEDERRSATVEAIDELEALGIPGVDMRALLHRHGEIAVKLVIALGRRLRAANERLARQSFQTVQSRVAAVLAQLVEQAQAEGAGERDIAVVATQADLAKLAGSSRESASRFLAVLERAGVISQGRGRLTVHDPAALQGYVY